MGEEGELGMGGWEEGLGAVCLARGWTGILRQCLSSPLFFVRAHPNNKSMLNEPVSHERGSSLAVSCCCRVRACRVRACTMHELSPCCALETPVMDIVS